MNSAWKKTLRRLRRSKSATPRPRLRLEGLEDRSVPAAGALDPTFGNIGYGTDGFSISNLGLTGSLSPRASAIQADDKVVVVGDLNDNHFQDSSDIFVARYLPDGRLDPSFGAGGVKIIDRYDPAIPFEQRIRGESSNDVVIRGDKIVIVGSEASGFLDGNALVIELDGIDGGGASPKNGYSAYTFDVTFFYNGSNYRSQAVWASTVALAPNNDIIVGGGFSGDPNLFDSFNSGIGTQMFLARMSQVGTITNLQTLIVGNVFSDNRLTKIAVQPDGKVVGVGNWRGTGASSLPTGTDAFMLRTTPYFVPETTAQWGSNAFDHSFGLGGIGYLSVPWGGSNSTEVFLSVGIQPDGWILASGSFLPGNFGAGFGGVWRFKCNGDVDLSFGNSGFAYLSLVPTPTQTDGYSAVALSIRPDAKIVVGGYAGTLPQPGGGTGSGSVIARLNPDGQPDTTFGDGGKTLLVGTNTVADMVVQSDGQIVLTGRYSQSQVYTTRVTEDGRLDATGRAVTPIGAKSDDRAYAVAIQSDGKALLAGWSAPADGQPDFAVVRYNPDGTVDTRFGAGGKAVLGLPGADNGNSVAVDDRGRVLVGGYSAIGGYRFAVARFDENGNPDGTFGSGGFATIPFGSSNVVGYAIATQPGGKVLIAGIAGSTDMAVARLDVDGSLDASFGINGFSIIPIGPRDEAARSIAIQSDGKIVLGGYSWNGANYDMAAVRLTPNGALDTSFAGGKVVIPIGSGDDVAYSVAIDSDGHVVLGGTTLGAAATSYDFAAARLTPDGQLDPQFDGDGRASVDIRTSADYGIGMAVEPGGRIIVVGDSYNGATADFTAIRLNTNGTLDPTFDGDGRRFFTVGGGQDSVWSVVVQPNGRIVMGGHSYNGQSYDFALARLEGNESNTPVDIDLSNSAVPENHPSGAIVGTLSATDPDAGDTFFYTLVNGSGGTDNGSFTIVGNDLQTAAAFDHEVKSSYSVRIRVTDSAGLSFEKPFTITVTNVNESPTDISLSNASVPENQPGGTLVGTLAATDPDAGESFTFALTSGTGDTHNARFQIVGNELRTAESFDYEAGSTFSVRVRVTDAGGLTFEKPFTITVTDENESPTDITLSSTSIAENQPLYTVVGTLSAADVDAGDTFTFELVAGTGDSDNGAFAIVGDELRTGVVFNREVRENLSIRVRVTDSGGLTFEKAIPITVTDVVETGPHIHGTVGGVTWEYDPVADSLQIFGRTTADNILLYSDHSPFVVNGLVTILEANGSTTMFDGQGGLPVIYTNLWNHPRFVGIDGGAGNDGIDWSTISNYQTSSVNGGAGNDTMNGGGGPDVLAGGVGADVEDGGNGSDIYQASGTDALLDTFADTGGFGTDMLVNVGETHLDLRGFSSANGIDAVDGGGFAVRGDGTANTLDFRAAELRNLIYVDGADGNDLIYTSSVPVVEGAAQFQGYFGDDHNDTLIGGSAADKLFGENGKDSLVGGDGPDLLDGGAGADVLDGGSGPDTMQGSLGNDSLFGGDGADILDGSDGADALNGGADNDELIGGIGNDLLAGSSGDDRLVGGPGADAQDGEAGSDTYEAAGTEALLDVFSDSNTTGTDTLRNVGSTHLDVRAFSPSNGIELIDGNGFAIRGDGTANTLDFRAAELVNVKYVDGADGNDTIYASNLPVAFPLFEGYFGDDGSDTLYGGAAPARLFGENGNDRLVGGDANDTLVGGAGTDTLNGGLGDDIFYLGDISGPAVNDDVNNNGIDDDDEGLVPSFIG
jgi:uncharacterized delta-60 repeat protein